MTNASKLPASAEAFVDGDAPGQLGSMVAKSEVCGLDYAEILRSAGEAAYEWQIDSDRLIWSDNACAMFGLRNDRPIASGRGYANLFDLGNGTTRFDAIFQSQEIDGGSGVAYQVQYALRTNARSPKLWIEDTGRWFAGEDGKPGRAHGPGPHHQ